MGLRSIVASVSILVFTVSVIGLVVALICYEVYTSSYERRASIAFLEVFSLSTIVSGLLVYALRKYMITSIVEGFLVVALSWLIVPAISSLAYIESIGMDFVDAYFESLSGFSGTGLTMILKPENMPHVVLLWRAVTQWVGELGVVVFSGTFLPRLHRIIRSVYVIERGERIAPTILQTMRRMFSIYVVYTVVGTVLFMLFGMNLFDAVTHSMTAIATGGMSTKSSSLGYWIHDTKGLGLYISSIIVMILGALNFVDHDNLFRGRIRQFLSSAEVRGFFAILAILGAAIVLPYTIQGKNLYAYENFYHLVSALTTTGFQLSSLKCVDDYTKIVLVIAMIIGGATFSTAGGLKVKRVIVIMKSVVWECARVFAPAAMVVRRKIGREVLEDRDILSIYNFFTIYMLTLIIISTLIAMHGYKFIDAVFETASALSCVGLSVGITSPSAPISIKIALMIAMYLGRLEFALLYLVIGYSYLRKLML